MFGIQFKLTYWSKNLVFTYTDSLLNKLKPPYIELIFDKLKVLQQVQSSLNSFTFGIKRNLKIVYNYLRWYGTLEI